MEGRRAFTEEIAAQGLRKEIRDLAHRELDAIEGRKKVEQWAPPETRDERDRPAEDRLPLSPYITPWQQRRSEALREVRRRRRTFRVVRLAVRILNVPCGYASGSARSPSSHKAHRRRDAAFLRCALEGEK